MAEPPTDWETSQARFEKLPLDVRDINQTMKHLNELMAGLGGSMSSVEADLHVMVMLLSRIEMCVQKQSEAMLEIRDALTGQTLPPDETD